MAPPARNPWFVSDVHLGHSSILRHTNRGKYFNSIKEHDDHMIAVINDYMTDKDVIYFVGDLALGDKWHCAALIERIKGHKHLIIGNHDEPNIEFYKTNGLFASINQHLEIKHDGEKIWMSHYGSFSWPSGQHGSWHLHGHDHGDSDHASRGLGNKKILDVGIDCSPFHYPLAFTIPNYRPFDFEYIKDRMAQREKNEHHGVYR